MSIRFKITFSSGSISFVEYEFDDWNDFYFDMLHYNEEGARIDSKMILNFSVRKAMKNLINNGKKNGATIKITERNGTNTIKNIYLCN